MPWIVQSGNIFYNVDKANSAQKWEGTFVRKQLALLPAIPIVVAIHTVKNAWLPCYMVGASLPIVYLPRRDVAGG